MIFPYIDDVWYYADHADLNQGLMCLDSSQRAKGTVDSPFLVSVRFHQYPLASRLELPGWPWS